MAQFKCGSKTCAALHEGGCGFEMIQEMYHCSREEGMVRVRFKNWDSRMCPPHHSFSLLASTCVPTSRACSDGDVSETAQPHNPHALHPRPRPMQVQQLILRPLMPMTDAYLDGAPSKSPLKTSRHVRNNLRKLCGDSLRGREALWWGAGGRFCGGVEQWGGILGPAQQLQEGTA